MPENKLDPDGAEFCNLGTRSVDVITHADRYVVVIFV